MGYFTTEINKASFLYVAIQGTMTFSGQPLYQFKANIKLPMRDSGGKSHGEFLSLDTNAVSSILLSRGLIIIKKQEVLFRARRI